MTLSMAAGVPRLHLWLDPVMQCRSSRGASWDDHFLASTLCRRGRPDGVPERSGWRAKDSHTRAGHPHVPSVDQHSACNCTWWHSSPGQGNLQAWLAVVLFQIRPAPACAVTRIRAGAAEVSVPSQDMFVSPIGLAMMLGVIWIGVISR